MRSYRPVGWRGESYRHYLASKGVSGGRRSYAVTKLDVFVRSDPELKAIYDRGSEGIKLAQWGRTGVRPELQGVVRGIPANVRDRQSYTDRKFYKDMYGRMRDIGTVRIVTPDGDVAYRKITPPELGDQTRDEDGNLDHYESLRGTDPSVVVESDGTIRMTDGGYRHGYITGGNEKWVVLPRGTVIEDISPVVSAGEEMEQEGADRAANVQRLELQYGADIALARSLARSKISGGESGQSARDRRVALTKAIAKRRGLGRFFVREGGRTVEK